ncbi:ABC transporter ATP-binding protein [Nonomuraea sp. NPDC050547]|uniref:ABC transporter ATP-binding protein n=1 Tax=unclassified Nonomuraea TaxID=2593643 RepID=UPI0037B63ADD
MTNRRGRRLLRQCLVRVRADLLRAVAAAVVRQLAFLALPWLLGRAVDLGVRAGSVPAAAGYAGAFVVVAAAEYAGMRGWQKWATLADVRAGAWLRTRLLRAILAVDTETMRRDAAGFGDLSTRATRDVGAVQVWVHGLTTWVVIGATGLVLVPALAGLDPLLLLIAALTVPLLLAVNRVFPPLFDRRAEELAVAHSGRGTVAEHLLTALLPLRGVGADRLMVERHQGHSAEVSRHTMRLASVGSAWEAAVFVVPRLAVVAGLFAGGYAALEGRLTVGELTTFVLWMGTVSLAVTVMTARLGDRAEARVAAGRIEEILALPGVPEGGSALPRAGLLRVSGLSVEREGGLVLGPLELSAAPGEWVVLTGATGSGKSTLLRAIAQLVPSTGEASFGGVPLRGSDPGDLYRTLGFVPQGPLLLHGTIAENLRLSGDHPDHEIERAAFAAGLDLVLSGLGDGWDTQAGERGGALSGGQRQLIVLARALLRDCPVLLLDDVTSALDAGTEARVLDRLRRATAGKAVVFAGHSPAVLARADRRVALAGGTLTQEPTRA